MKFSMKELEKKLSFNKCDCLTEVTARADMTALLLMKYINIYR